jgi:RNA polymerase sigma factor (sigma-70 family)
VLFPSEDFSDWYSAEVQPHAGELRAWLGGKFPALNDPDDLVQEALVRVWRERRARPVPAPKALLFTTARNLALDQLRRRQVVRIDGLAEIADLPVLEQSPSAADTTAHHQELDLLTQALQSLPERCRQVLTLRKIYGLSQREIAAQLGISEHTVEAQVGNGMKRCAEFLARHGLP